MKLREFYETTYRPLRLIGKSHGTLRQYDYAMTHWERLAGDPPLSDVTDLSLAAVMSALLARGDGACTVNKTRRHLLAVLRFAKKRKLLAEVPDVEPLPEPKRIPRAWLLPEIEAILQAAGRLPGATCGLPTADWWKSLLLACYDSGGRVGAVIASSPKSLDWNDGTLRLLPENQKDNEEQLIRLHPQTLDAIRRIAPIERPRIWPWPYRREALYRGFRRIIKAAGVEVGAGPCSLFHRLRRTNASYLKAGGGDPTAQLGHSTPQVTARYLDPRICGGPQAVDVLPRPNLT